MRFQYQALHDDGRVVTGLIDAPSERSAHRDLLKRGVHPTSIAAAAPRRASALRPRRGVSARNHGAILKQLSVLIEGGVPIAEAAPALAAATPNPPPPAPHAPPNAHPPPAHTFP